MITCEPTGAIGRACVGRAKTVERDTVAISRTFSHVNLAEPGWFNWEKAAMFRILSDHSDTG